MAVQHRYDDDRPEHPKKRSRLIIDIVPELRRRIKIAAAENDLSVQEYVGQILEQAVPPERNRSESERERKPLNRKAVDRLMQTREAIKRAHPGQDFGDSVEILRELREERTRELEQQ